MEQKLTLILNARLKPEAKNPPNGPMTELKMLSDKECNRNGYIVKTVSVFPLKNSRLNSMLLKSSTNSQF